MNRRFFLDTNVFLYALGAMGSERDASRNLLQRAHKLVLVTSAEVLQEILHVRRRRFGTELATAAVRDAAELVDEVLQVGKHEIFAACSLLESTPSLDARDALHIVTARRHGAEMISFDTGFDAVRGLRRYTPNEALESQVVY
jgi:uncharacterized protein